MISGDHPSLLGGAISSFTNEGIAMTRNVKNVHWLKKKYGEGVKPYEICIKMTNPPMDKINDMNILNIEYNYTFLKGGKNEMFVEGYPPRELIVQDPFLYKG